MRRGGAAGTALSCSPGPLLSPGPQRVASEDESGWPRLGHRLAQMHSADSTRLAAPPLVSQASQGRGATREAAKASRDYKAPPSHSGPASHSIPELIPSISSSFTSSLTPHLTSFTLCSSQPSSSPSPSPLSSSTHAPRCSSPLLAAPSDCRCHDSHAPPHTPPAVTASPASHAHDRPAAAVSPCHRWRRVRPRCCERPRYCESPQCCECPRCCEPRPVVTTSTFHAANKRTPVLTLPPRRRSSRTPPPYAAVRRRRARARGRSPRPA